MLQPAKRRRGISSCNLVEVNTTGASVDRRSRLIEPNMPGAADAEDLKIDATRCHDSLLVALANSVDFSLRDLAGWKMRIGRIKVDVIKQTMPHEYGITFRMPGRKPEILVKIKGHDITKAQTLLAM